MRLKQWHVFPWFGLSVLLLGAACAKTNMVMSDVTNDVFVHRISAYEWVVVDYGESAAIFRRSLFDNDLANLKSLFGTETIKPHKREEDPWYHVRFYKKGSDARPLLLGELGLWPQGKDEASSKIVVEWDGTDGQISSRGTTKYLMDLKSLRRDPEKCLDWIRDVSSVSVPLDWQCAAIAWIPKHLGDKKKRAVPLLEGLLQNKEERIVDSAARVLFEIDANHIQATKQLSIGAVPALNVEALIENGSVVFLVKHINVNQMSTFEVYDERYNLLWDVRTRFAGEKIVYGALPNAKGETARQEYPAPGEPLEDIRGKMINVQITYRYWRRIEGEQIESVGSVVRQIKVPSEKADNY
jgi:hypothetical protein